MRDYERIQSLKVKLQDFMDMSRNQAIFHMEIIGPSEPAVTSSKGQRDTFNIQALSAAQQLVP